MGGALGNVLFTGGSVLSTAASLLGGADQEKDYYRLQPENDYMDPIIVPEVEIIGKVIGLFRMFR